MSVFILFVYPLHTKVLTLNFPFCFIIQQYETDLPFSRQI